MRQIAIKEIGMLKDLYARISPYIGLINMTLLAATAYYTTIRHFLHINFLEFIILIAVVVLTVAAVEYFIVMPSHYAFINEQAYKHGNLIRRDLTDIRAKELHEILAVLNELREKLDNLERRGKT